MTTTYGYKCPECGKGIIRPQKFQDYETKVDNYPFIVPTAIQNVYH